MSSREKKRKKHEKKSSLALPQTPQFLSLPDELVLSCLARVLKSYYPTLFLVCKCFRSLLASPELYQTRSLLNRTESFLYVYLQFRSGISSIIKSAVIEGEIYVDVDYEGVYVLGPYYEGVAYKPKEDRWKAMIRMSNLATGWERLSYCVINNILYCYNIEGIKWYDTKGESWIRLKGLLNFANYSSVTLANYGGKLVVLWDSSSYQSKRIWCAVIVLERRSILEMWGEVEWLDAVLTVPKSYEFVCALTVTV